MKPNELMIGNWVLKDMNYSEEDPMYTQPTYQPYQIMTGDDIELACETNCIGDDDVYLPIPLTAEILEKNGWRQDLYSNESYDNEEIELLSFWVGEDGRNAWWWHAGVELVIPINYVHQLQNALALCGIKKEIEL